MACVNSHSDMVCIQSPIPEGRRKPTDSIIIIGGGPNCCPPRPRFPRWPFVPVCPKPPVMSDRDIIRMLLRMLQEMMRRQPRFPMPYYPYADPCYRNPMAKYPGLLDTAM